MVKGSAPVADAGLRDLDATHVCILAVTRAELRWHTLPWDEVAAAKVRADLEQGGTPIGVMDAMIAAHAKALGAVLVTNNVQHFRLVRGLAIEN